MSKQTRTATTTLRTVNPWDKARRRLLKRTNAITPKPEPIDREINYFLLQLERLGLETEWSCAGHPSGFYITFSASYLQALVINSYGYFTVTVTGANYWTLGFSYPHTSSRERNRTMRSAASAWERAFGPLEQEPPAWTELAARLFTPTERGGRQVESPGVPGDRPSAARLIPVKESQHES